MAKKISAGDLLKSLNNDQEYQAGLKIEQEKIQADIEASREAEKPLVRELQSQGIFVQSIFDLNSAGPLKPDVTNTLLKWLPADLHDRTKASILTLLRSTKEKFDATPLVRFFIEADDEELKSTAAITLSQSKHFGADQWLREVFSDSKYGDARYFLADAVATHLPPEDAEQLLLPHLREAPILISPALVKCGSEKTLANLREVAKTERGEAKKEILKSLKKIEKKLGVGN